MDDLNKDKDKNIELIEFLNQEKLSKKIHSKKIYTFYNKCLIKSILELESKFNNIDNKKLCLINGINMIYYIFYILIFYTNNIKLTIFLLERSILFYSEFIIMSQDKKLIDQICFVPNINDALFFTYKKTIGPIELCKIKVKPEQIYIRDISRIINLIYKEILINSNKDKLLDLLNIIQSELSYDLYNVYLSFNLETDRKKIYYLIFEIFEKTIDIEDKIILVKIFLISILNFCKKNIENPIDNVFEKINNYNEILETNNILNYKQLELYKNLNDI